jgi:hypothetical protein
MTKGDWKKIIIASSISIFIGIAVLIFVLTRRNKSLSKARLKKIVEEDLKKWEGIKETDPQGKEMVQWYWGLLGMHFTTDFLSSPSNQSAYPWSAAYISALMYRWGADNRFRYSASHSNYIVDAMEERVSPKGNLFTAFRTTEAPVEIGDIVALDRGFGINYDNIYRGAQTHADVVFKVEKTDNGYVAHTIGGNVSDTVKVRLVPLDQNKRIMDGKYFAVLKNNAL